MVLIAAVSNE